jgi:acyl-CoA synthetase (AMP-forming)/AMP-acid ligase II
MRKRGGSEWQSNAFRERASMLDSHDIRTLYVSILIVSALPRSGSGKVQWRLLQERENELATPGG